MSGLGSAAPQLSTMEQNVTNSATNGAIGNIWDLYSGRHTQDLCKVKVYDVTA